MGLFDKIKKAAPVAAAGAAAAGVYAGKAFSKEENSENKVQNPTSNTEEATTEASGSATPTSQPASSTFQTPPVTEASAQEQTPSASEQTSTYDPDTGATTYQYSNGNSLTEYPDGSRTFYDAASGETTEYNAQTGETTTYESDGDVVVDSSDGSRVTFESDGDVVGQASDGTTMKVTYDPTTGNTIVEGYDGINTGVFNSSGELISTTYAASTDSASEQTSSSLFSRIMEVNAEIPDEMKAAGIGIPDQPVQEFRTYQEGSWEDGQVRYGYEARYGLGSTYSTSHTGQDEIASGVNLNSEATYNAQSFMGAASSGEVGAEWNSEQAHLYAQGRAMVGAEANVDAAYKGTLDVEGVNYQPGAEVQGHANAFAGAEAEGRGDLNVSSDGARGSLGGGAFAGARADASGSGALSIDGNDFARGEGGVDARAGIGAEFSVDAGYQNGQISYGFDVGAALGVGAGYQYSGSVDAPGIVTHPDAVWESAVEEVSSYVPEIPSYSTDPSTYTAQAEQYVVQQVQEYIPVPQEVSQVAEIVTDPGSLF
jgi:hypothetical protein